MIPNNSGKIVMDKWIWLSEQYSYVVLDQYITMPNHFHGILAIVDGDRNGRDRSLQKVKSISSLIGAFKTTSSKEIHLNSDKAFKWQKSFYDRIIRNEAELSNIQRYIFYNPLSWQNDIENSNRYSKHVREKYYDDIIQNK